MHCYRGCGGPCDTSSRTSTHRAPSEGGYPGVMFRLANGAFLGIALPRQVHKHRAGALPMITRLTSATNHAVAFTVSATTAPSLAAPCVSALSKLADDCDALIELLLATRCSGAGTLASVKPPSWSAKPSEAMLSVGAAVALTLASASRNSTKQALNSPLQVGTRCAPPCVYVDTSCCGVHAASANVRSGGT